MGCTLVIDFAVPARQSYFYIVKLQGAHTHGCDPNVAQLAFVQRQQDVAARRFAEKVSFIIHGQ